MPLNYFLQDCVKQFFFPMIDNVFFTKLDMHLLAAASRSRLLETEPKLFVFETLYYAFCGRYCFEYVASKVNVNTVKQH